MLLGPSVTECYQQEQFTLTDNVWVPLDRPHPAISWPGRGAVSVIIHTACEENNNWRELTAAEIAETRREPGCEFYAWFENINAPCDLLLLETWATGQLYDVHWLGRVRSTVYRGNSGRTPTPRAREEVSREFYRRQEFQFHYGRLQPIRAEDIPSDAGAATGKGAGKLYTVRVAKGEPGQQTIEERQVRIGLNNRVRAEVLSGLQEGEQVVVGDAGANQGSAQRRGPRMF